MSKAATGVTGLDAITNGGIPRERVTLISGDTGAGKTILAMQMLVSGARQFGERGLFVSFEEHADEVAQNMAAFGWRVAPWTRGGEEGADVQVIDAVPDPDVVQAGDFDLAALLAGVSAAARQISARRVVFDGLDVLLDLLDTPRQRRREIARIRQWTRQNAITALITAKQVDDKPPAGQSEYQFLRFIVSCVITLQNVARGGSTERTIRILKMRGSSHSSSSHPLVLRHTGIQVGDVGSSRLAYAAPDEHVSSGIARLDTMLGGGYYRASSILVSGAPGTAKSTLAGAFVDAACRRGEKSLLISFDEAFAQIQRNLGSVNIHLAQHVASGLLATAGFRTGRLGGEDHLYQIMQMIEAHEPRTVVIDPISALDKVADLEIAGDLAERLIDECKVRGITILMTSLLDSSLGTDERTRVQISSVADTWIQLSFTVIGGERNRALTIIKSRGNAHSNQVRELVLSRSGLELADVYAQGGAVLMGTARLEKEHADRVSEDLRAREAEREREAVEASAAQVRADIARLQSELSQLEKRRSSELSNEAGRREHQDEMTRKLLERRSADRPDAPASASAPLRGEYE